MKKPRLNLATLSVSVCLALASMTRSTTGVQAIPAPIDARVSNHWEIAQAFKPPNLGAPPATAGGGVRGSCIKSSTPLTALMPANSLPLTVAANPTFLVYIPKTEAKTVEFVLKDEQDNDVYRTSRPVPATAGIVSVKLPNDKAAQPLKVGKNYHWFLALVCQAEDRSEDVFVEAWIQRTTLSADAAKELQKVAPTERAGVYAKNGIWHESVSNLAELRRQRPNDAKIAANWQELLKSVGLEKIAKEPLVQ